MKLLVRFAIVMVTLTVLISLHAFIFTSPTFAHAIAQTSARQQQGHSIPLRPTCDPSFSVDQSAGTSTRYSLPIHVSWSCADGVPLDLDISWGDGTSTHSVRGVLSWSGTYSHIWKKSGNYIVGWNLYYKKLEDGNAVTYVYIY